MKRGNEYDGTLIAIEGLDGAGKSSVMDAIEAWAEDADHEVVTTKEPTDMWTGDTVYRSLSDDDASAMVDFSLFVADRVKHVEERIVPALKRGAVVVTDRYADSTRAYQTHRIADETGMSYDEARRWMETVFEPFNVEADITLYLDIGVDTAVERAAGEDKYEKRKNLERVKATYDEMYGLCDSDIRIIDGEQSLSAVQHQAVNTVKAALYEPEPSSSEKTYADAVTEE